MEQYDIIIIGTGAGGGTLAWQLAPTGKKILILERGDYVPREKENWSSEAVFMDGRYTAKESWYDKNDAVFHPGIHYCVGGNTKFYGAALLRFRAEDFDELKHEGGVSPAWPISYAELSPYYLKAEQLYCVNGERGIDPTEPPESQPFPLPPLAHEPSIQKLHDDLKAVGLRPFPLPMGVRQDVSGDTPVILDRFDGYPDPTETKADAHVCCIRAALKHPNVTMITNCHVDRLETDATGKQVKTVHATIGEETLVFSANIVAVCCGAINSAALLLRSASEAHPKGLANGSDVVGRHYMAHNNSVMMAFSTEKNTARFGKTLGLNDFYFGDQDFAFPMGHIQMVGKSDEWNLKAESPFPVPSFPLKYIAEHSLDFWLTSEDLPDPRNQVLLKEDGSIAIHYYPNNLKAHEQLQKKLKSILEHLNLQPHILPNHIYLSKQIPIAGTAHQAGTIRFGNDPQTSALDTNCRAHEVDNLYVVDGSFFPSIAAVNPSLTIMAMAIRVGEHIAQSI
ncbi:MAG: GMC family oxidoreductase [Bacteroidota bacterium]